VVDVSVIICAYTEARWTELVDAVHSAIRQDPPPREVIVVVDHNAQLFTRVAQELPAVRVVENTEALGLSGARNSGIAVALGDILCFLDDDAVATADWLVRLTEHYQNVDVLGVGGSIEPGWSAGRPFWFPEEFDWVVGCTYRGMPESTAPVRNLIGCNMSFRRAVFSAVGGFSSGIGRVGTRPVGCEETELCIRVQQRDSGSILLYEPRAPVLHRVPAIRARWSYFLARCYSEGLSKALVAQLVGSHDGLSTERAYTLRTLPQGIVRGLADTARGKPSGLARAVAIVVGLAFTAAGYVAGRLTGRRARPQPELESSRPPKVAA
jgi:GT2 family glycosyltransferase